MFTLEQIEAAHLKVKSGADFPDYAEEMKALGVKYYVHYVINGSMKYFGDENFSISSGAKYASVKVADTGSPEKLQTDLKNHQQRKTDYPNFCKQAADDGVEKWIVDLVRMICTYYDKRGAHILEEKIPLF